jgi:hypothetical protein
MTMQKSSLDDKDYPTPTATLPLDTPEDIAASLVIVANQLYQGKIGPRAASVFGQLCREAISAHKAKFTARLKALEEAHAAMQQAQGMKRRSKKT